MLANLKIINVLSKKIKILCAQTKKSFIKNLALALVLAKNLLLKFLLEKIEIKTLNINRLLILKLKILISF